MDYNMNNNRDVIFNFGNMVRPGPLTETGYGEPQSNSQFSAQQERQFMPYSAPIYHRRMDPYQDSALPHWNKPQDTAGETIPQETSSQREDWRQVLPGIGQSMGGYQPSYNFQPPQHQQAVALTQNPNHYDLGPPAQPDLALFATNEPPPTQKRKRDGKNEKQKEIQAKPPRPKGQLGQEEQAEQEQEFPTSQSGNRGPVTGDYSKASRKRNAVAVACIPCREKKGKCNEGSKICNRCRKANIACEWPPKEEDKDEVIQALKAEKQLVIAIIDTPNHDLSINRKWVKRVLDSESKQYPSEEVLQHVQNGRTPQEADESSANQEASNLEESLGSQDVQKMAQPTPIIDPRLEQDVQRHNNPVSVEEPVPAVMGLVAQNTAQRTPIINPLSEQDSQGQNGPVSADLSGITQPQYPNGGVLRYQKLAESADNTLPQSQEDQGVEGFGPDFEKDVLNLSTEEFERKYPSTRPLNTTYPDFVDPALYSTPVPFIDGTPEMQTSFYDTHTAHGLHPGTQANPFSFI